MPSSKAAAFPRLEVLEDRTLLATCNVTRLTDTGAGLGFRGDLRYCMSKTNSTPGLDVIEFRVTGIINLQSVLPNINDDLVIFGPGVNDLTVRRDTGGNYRIFTVNEGKTAEIYNLTATNGTGGILNLGTLTLAFAAVVDNTNNLVDGGGITNVGTLTAHQVTITGNTNTLGPGTKGGGIYNFIGATADISFATISGNTAVNTNHNFVGATGGNGGGIYNEGNMSIEFSTIANNTIHCVVYKNACFPSGGGIYNAASLSIEFSTIANNAITCKNYDYWCVSKGGGIANLDTMTIRYSTIDGNTSEGEHQNYDYAYGGGIHNSGTLTVDSSTVSNNLAGSLVTAHVFGGGIATAGGTLTVVNSTIAGNQSVASVDCLGGGLSLEGSTVIRNSTIVGNSCHAENLTASGGGIGLEGSPSLSMRNNIVAANFAVTSGTDLHGILTSSGFNIFGDPSGGSGYDSTDMLSVDPMLGPLADHGGTTLTYSLLLGSPAIDAGDNIDAPEFDQRGSGFPRLVNNTIDIGAFECQIANCLTTGGPGGGGAPIPPPPNDGGSASPADAVVASGAKKPNFRSDSLSPLSTLLDPALPDDFEPVAGVRHNRVMGTESTSPFLAWSLALPIVDAEFGG